MTGTIDPSFANETYPDGTEFCIGLVLSAPLASRCFPRNSGFSIGARLLVTLSDLGEDMVIRRRWRWRKPRAARWRWFEPRAAARSCRRSPTTAIAFDSSRPTAD